MAGFPSAHSSEGVPIIVPEFAPWLQRLFRCLRWIHSDAQNPQLAAGNCVSDLKATGHCAAGGACPGSLQGGKLRVTAGEHICALRFQRLPVSDSLCLPERQFRKASRYGPQGAYGNRTPAAKNPGSCESCRAFAEGPAACRQRHRTQGKQATAILQTGDTEWELRDLRGGFRESGAPCAAQECDVWIIPHMISRPYRVPCGTFPATPAFGPA